jgi:hypothetical protein
MLFQTSRWQNYRGKLARTALKRTVAWFGAGVGVALFAVTALWGQPASFALCWKWCLRLRSCACTLSGPLALGFFLAVAWAGAILTDIVAERWRNRLDPRMRAMTYSALP